MKATLEDCRNTFKVGYEAFEKSKIEAEEVRDLYHNRHYTTGQLIELEQRGQPKETFNVIKMFTRMLLGYYSSIVNTVVVKPRNPRDVTTATVLNDIVNYIFEDNRMDIEGDQIKLNGFISGLLCSYVEVIDTDEKDQFGNILKKIKINHVPDYELVLDPDSILDDYSDAKYIHRFKWYREADIKRIFGKQAHKKLQPYINHLNTTESEFDYRNQSYSNFRHHFGRELGSSGAFQSYYRLYNQYLIVHTVMEDDSGKLWSIYWHDDVELFRKEITYQITKFPYRVQKLHSSNRQEHYGLFREVVESQKAINQAIIQVQLMSNSTKVIVQENAVQDINQFKTLVNRVNSVIPVLDIKGVQLQEMTREILDQYTIIDKSLDRIQRILGINDSFLGMAYASDSGRKVKLQKNATIMSLRYITARIESFYRSLAIDVAQLVKQYYKANQVLRVTDNLTGDRWVEINKPMMKPTGNINPDGTPQQEPVLILATDPANGETLTDELGNVMLEPVPMQETEVAFTEFDIKIESSAYDDEEEKAQMMLESVTGGMIGQMLAQVNPVGFFKFAELSVMTSGTKYSPEMSRILNETSAMLQGSFEAQQEASLMAQGSSGRSGSAPSTQSSKIPTNQGG